MMVPFPDTYKLGALALSLVVFFVVGYTWGRHTANGECAVKELAATVKAKQEFDEKAKTINELSEQLEKLKNERKATNEKLTKEVDRIIERPVYRTACLDDDGLRVANDALLGKSPDTGKPDAAMPAVKATR